MFLPMSCTSPLTVDMMMTPAFSEAVEPLLAFSSSMKGIRCATAFFITLADLITCAHHNPSLSPLPAHVLLSLF